MTSNPPTAAENETARRPASPTASRSTWNGPARSRPSSGRKRRSASPTTTWDEYRSAVRKSSVADATEAAGILFAQASKGALIVVSGDADAIGQARAVRRGDGRGSGEGVQGREEAGREEVMATAKKTTTPARPKVGPGPKRKRALAKEVAAERAASPRPGARSTAGRSGI